ncbi:hypothetical protein HanRHA438_Chr07g0326841 [Helianthus annuus]|nr:hypothetical protein HanRHA438_Chr07g0326841 [Helianthus annuus]
MTKIPLPATIHRQRPEEGEWSVTASGKHSRWRERERERPKEKTSGGGDMRERGRKREPGADKHLAAVKAPPPGMTPLLPAFSLNLHTASSTLQDYRTTNWPPWWRRKLLPSLPLSKICTHPPSSLISFSSSEVYIFHFRVRYRCGTHVSEMGMTTK